LLVAGGADETVVSGMLSEASSNMPRIVTELRAKAAPRRDDAGAEFTHNAAVGEGFGDTTGSPFGGSPLPNGPFGGASSPPSSGRYGSAPTPPPPPSSEGPFGGPSGDSGSPFR
jgi:hypothetical protein